MTVSTLLKPDPQGLGSRHLTMFRTIELLISLHACYDRLLADTRLVFHTKVQGLTLKGKLQQLIIHFVHI